MIKNYFSYRNLTTSFLNSLFVLPLVRDSSLFALATFTLLHIKLKKYRYPWSEQVSPHKSKFRFRLLETANSLPKPCTLSELSQCPESSWLRFSGVAKFFRTGRPFKIVYMA